MKSISLLGATGSIGQQTLDTVKEHPEEFQIAALSAGKNIEKTKEIIRDFQPKLVSVQRESDALALQKLFPKVDFTYGEKGLVDVATYSDSTYLLNSVLGSVGLEPTLAAIKQQKTIAIANKETLVTAGHLVMSEAAKYGAQILPVDSEHSALWQSMVGEDRRSISKLIVTASGGSFRDKTRYELENVTVKEALNHPNWSMGAKITIDSATLMNKGLEVIEAAVLFDMPYDDIEVVIHRESIIHSLVEYQDTSVIAQLGTPDMRTAIQYALTYPDRLPRLNAERLDLAKIGQLNFKKADFERFRCLGFAYNAGRQGGTILTVMNAANEEAVAAFLAGKIKFLEIEDIIDKMMQQHDNIVQPDLETILFVDKETRKTVQDMLK